MIFTIDCNHFIGEVATREEWRSMVASLAAKYREDGHRHALDYFKSLRKSLGGSWGFPLLLAGPTLGETIPPEWLE